MLVDGEGLYIIFHQPVIIDEDDRPVLGRVEGLVVANVIIPVAGVGIVAIGGNIIITGSVASSCVINTGLSSRLAMAIISPTAPARQFRERAGVSLDDPFLDIYLICDIKIDYIHRRKMSLERRGQPTRRIRSSAW